MTGEVEMNIRGENVVKDIALILEDLPVSAADSVGARHLRSDRHLRVVELMTAGDRPRRPQDGIETEGDLTVTEGFALRQHPRPSRKKSDEGLKVVDSGASHPAAEIDQAAALSINRHAGTGSITNRLKEGEIGGELGESKVPGKPPGK